MDRQTHCLDVWPSWSRNLKYFSVLCKLGTSHFERLSNSRKSKSPAANKYKLSHLGVDNIPASDSWQKIAACLSQGCGAHCCTDPVLRAAHSTRRRCCGFQLDSPNWGSSWSAQHTHITTKPELEPLILCLGDEANRSLGISPIQLLQTQVPQQTQDPNNITKMKTQHKLPCLFRYSTQHHGSLILLPLTLLILFVCTCSQPVWTTSASSTIHPLVPS